MKKFLLALSALLPGFVAAQSPDDFIKASHAGLEAQTAAHRSTWHFGEEERWEADMEQEKIVFHFADGSTATAPMQVIGTYNRDDGSFLWGWEHPSVPEPLRSHAKLAREWGQKNSVAEFTTRKVQVSEDRAWSFAAVASRLANANGVYRASAGSAYVYMTFGEIELKR